MKFKLTPDQLMVLNSPDFTTPLNNEYVEWARKNNINPNEWKGFGQFLQESYSINWNGTFMIEASEDAMAYFMLKHL